MTLPDKWISQIRVYYLNKEDKLQECCYSPTVGKWTPGALNNLNIQAAANTSIAAFQYSDSSGKRHIRVFCQGK